MKAISQFLNKHYELLLGYFICLMGVLITFALYEEPKNEYDLNNDGVVDIKDMLVIQKYILDNEEVK